jgi:hypothetical protein
MGRLASAVVRNGWILRRIRWHACLAALSLVAPDEEHDFDMGLHRLLLLTSEVDAVFQCLGTAVAFAAVLHLRSNPLAARQMPAAPEAAASQGQRPGRMEKRNS